MSEMDEKFNKGACIDTLRILSGHRTLKEMLHYDTLNYYLERLSPECCNAALYSRRKKHFIFDSLNSITALSFR